MQKKYYTLKYDPVFKNVFFRDPDLLKTFLTNIMRLFYDNFHIDSLEIKNTELTKDRLYVKNKMVDILVKTNNKIINIEVNSNYDEITKNRNLCYLLNSVVEGNRKKTNYHFTSDYIQINFNFLGKNHKAIESYHFNEDETKEKLTSSIRMININVDYYYHKWYNLNNKNEFFEKYKDIIIMNFSKDELDKLKDSDTYMDKIKKDIDELNSNDVFYQWMTDEEDEKLIRNSLYIDGLNKGTLQEKQIIAKNMLKDNMSVDVISKYTGLTKEEIENLK